MEHCSSVSIVLANSERMISRVFVVSSLAFSLSRRLCSSWYSKAFCSSSLLSIICPHNHFMVKTVWLLSLHSPLLWHSKYIFLNSQSLIITICLKVEQKNKTEINEQGNISKFEIAIPQPPKLFYSQSIFIKNVCKINFCSVILYIDIYFKS